MDPSTAVQEFDCQELDSLTFPCFLWLSPVGDLHHDVFIHRKNHHTSSTIVDVRVLYHKYQASGRGVFKELKLPKTGLLLKDAAYLFYKDMLTVRTNYHVTNMHLHAIIWTIEEIN